MTAAKKLERIAALVTSLYPARGREPLQVTLEPACDLLTAQPGARVDAILFAPLDSPPDVVVWARVEVGGVEFWSRREREVTEEDLAALAKATVIPLVPPPSCPVKP